LIIKIIKIKGYKIIYIPNFTPKSACNKENLLREIHEMITKDFGVKNIGSTKLLFDDKYFYDTGYHANKEGRKIKKRFLKPI